MAVYGNIFSASPSSIDYHTFLPPAWGPALPRRWGSSFVRSSGPSAFLPIIIFEWGIPLRCRPLLHDHLVAQGNQYPALGSHRRALQLGSGKSQTHLSNSSYGSTRTRQFHRSDSKPPSAALLEAFQHRTQSRQMVQLEDFLHIGAYTSETRRTFV